MLKSQQHVTYEITFYPIFPLKMPSLSFIIAFISFVVQNEISVCAYNLFNFIFRQGIYEITDFEVNTVSHSRINPVPFPSSAILSRDQQVRRTYDSHGMSCSICLGINFFGLFYWMSTQWYMFLLHITSSRIDSTPLLGSASLVGRWCDHT